MNRNFWHPNLIIYPQMTYFNNTHIYVQTSILEQILLENFLPRSSSIWTDKYLSFCLFQLQNRFQINQSPNHWCEDLKKEFNRQENPDIYCWRCKWPLSSRLIGMWTIEKQCQLSSAVFQILNWHVTAVWSCLDLKWSDWQQDIQLHFKICDYI